MRITNDLVLDDHEIKERFVRSMGADGQNPRRKATAVELRFDIDREISAGGVSLALAFSSWSAGGIAHRDAIARRRVSNCSNC